MAVSGNRWMLQSRYLLQNDRCDDCIITCQQALQCLACIMRAVGSEDADEVTAIADCVTCCVMSCSLAQQQVEIENIKETGMTSLVQDVLDLLPPKQQEMIK